MTPPKSAVIHDLYPGDAIQSDDLHFAGGSRRTAPRPRAWSTDWVGALCTLLDSLGERLALCTDGGEVVYVNRALRRAMLREPDGETLLSSLVALALKSDAEAGGELRAGEAACDGVSGRWVAAAIDLGTELLPAARRAVRITPTFREPITDEELRTSFRLTPREILTARLLGSGLGNAELASHLGISPHTARRHTEHVLAKLGAASRAEVRWRITR
jgi:DNA-binding CsgD family transcriptional regulator